MVSEDVGFVTLFERAVEKPIIKIKCQAHRLETVLSHAYKKCDNCPRLTAFLQNAHSFYSMSPKRKDDLKKYIRKHKDQGATFFVPKALVKTRWVASHYIAAKVIYLNYATLLGHLKSLLTSPHFKKDKATLERARHMISIMEQKHFLTSLALLLDIQNIFKGMSELYQTRGRAIIGQLNKKDDILKEIDEIVAQLGGEYMEDILSKTLCTDQSTATVTVCQSLNDFETQSVTIGGIALTGDEPLPLPIDVNHDKSLQIPFKDGLFANVEVESIVEIADDKYVATSSYIGKFTTALKAKVRSYFPHDELLKVMVSLDQTLYPLRVERILSDSEVLRMWRKWPTILGLTEEAQTVESDMRKVVEWLKDHPEFWCSNHNSQPDEFWSQVLKRFKEMPTNLVKVLKCTLSIPIAGADVERSFSILKFQKTALRNQMSPELLDTVIRLKMIKETWDTFDATRATELWTNDGHLICDHKHNTGNTPSASRPPRPPRPTTTEDQETCTTMEEETLRIFREHSYLIQNPVSTTLVDKKELQECFLIINKKNGRVLTAFEEEVDLRFWDSDNMDSQLWFWHGEHLVSRSTQKVLEANTVSEQKVSLNFYHPGLNRQKWKKIAWQQSLDFEFESKHHGYRLDILEKLLENGSTVGTSKPRGNSVTQRWKIEELGDYQN